MTRRVNPGSIFDTMAQWTPDHACGAGAVALRAGEAYFHRMDPFAYLIPIALLVVFGVLCFGIYAMFRGGDFGRSWSNKAMRMRVVAQFVAILILVGAMWWKQSHG
jgi:Hypoxia induced protein conserved region